MKTKYRRRIAIALLLNCLLLSGCFTPALWNAAEGTPASNYGVKIHRIVSGFKSSDGSTVHVCMEVFDFALRAERDVTLNIPVTDRRKWRIQRHLPAQSIANAQSVTDSNNGSTSSYIEYSPALSALTSGCITEGTSLPVVRSSFVQPEKNNTNTEKNTSSNSVRTMPEAVYVISRNDQPVNIGFLSDKPIFENSYSIDVPLQTLTNDSEHRPKHYLYLLTPVTLVMDTAVGVIYIWAWAYGGAHYQSSSQPSTLPGIRSISK